MYEKAMGLAQAKQGMDLTGALATDQLRQGNISTLQQLQNLRQSGVDFNSGQIERALGFATGLQGLQQSLQQGNGVLQGADKLSATQSLLGTFVDNYVDPTSGQLNRSVPELLNIARATANQIDPKLWKQIKGLVKQQLTSLKNRPANPVDPMDAIYNQMMQEQLNGATPQG
jgi:hypothetical protein